MPDKTIKCLECQKDFVWSESEQEFFKSQGLTNEPKRCPPCRAKRRVEKASNPRPRQDMQRG